MIVSALSIGLSLADIDNLTIGQVQDLLITYNNMAEDDTVREATQADIDRL